jgi:hypothetical protein
MGKKKNKQAVNVDHDNENFGHEDNQVDYPVPFPDRFDRDVLAVMDDETLHNVGRSLADSINKVVRFNLNPYFWEVELCYVQQEMQMRMIRRQAHQAWLGTATPTEMN